MFSFPFSLLKLEEGDQFPCPGVLFDLAGMVLWNGGELCSCTWR